MLTQWGSIEESGGSLDIRESAQSVWIKIVMSWASYLLYAWVMVAPPACPDRDFTSTALSSAEV